MTKKKLLLIPLLLFSAILMAQTKPKIEDMHVGKYVVKLITNGDNTYGYQIAESGKLIVNQKAKPYSKSQSGFTQKQNAMTIAIWVANQLKEGKNPNPPDAKKAKELGITNEDL